MPRFYLSPSRVARYYFHECDRYLRYASTPRAARAEEGVPPTELDRTLVTTAILESGYAWEAHVVNAYLADSAVIAPADGNAPLHERRHSVESTLEALRSARIGSAIYQPTLRAPQGFYDAYGLDRELVEFVDCHPDLLEVMEGPDGPEVRVVDVKASDMMKLAHRIQVALYSVILGHLVEAEGIPLRPSGAGGVWLFEQEEPEWFDLVYVRPPLETFLAHELQPILRAPASDALWHLYFRCEWCDYYSHCRQEAEQTDNISLVPYLSTFAKRHLATRANVTTVKEFGELLARPDADEALRGSASLEGRSRQLTLAVRALQSGEEIPTGAVSVGMPVGEHVRVILTIQSDPLSGSMYAYAINRIAGADIFGTKTETIARVAPSGGPDDIAGIRQAFVADLMAILRPIHDHNVAHSDEWKAQKTLQTYVFDSYERTLLVQVLLEAILDAACAEDALALLFHFQHPDLVAAENHPASEVFFPVIVLTEVIRSLLAMPVPVAYRFADVVSALKPSQYGFDYKHDDFWCFEISNRLKANAILSVWNNGRDDLIPNIEAELKRRVWAAGSVINGIRERLKGTDSLFAWPPKFKLPEGLDFNDPLLSRLAFIVRYETVLQYLDTRMRRAAPEEERLTRGDSIKLRAIGRDEFEIDPIHAELEISRTEFWEHIFTVDRPTGRRARLAYNDFQFRSAQWAPKNYDLALAKIREVRPGRLKLELKGGQSFDGPDEGDICYLEPRFTDPNSARVITELAALDKTPGSRYTRLIRDPVATRRPTTIKPTLLRRALELGNQHGMTPSQRAAFEGILDHDLQVVWGPPGTGKTHFLALAVLCFLETHRRAGQRFRVLISAFTHTAIDNCLTKLAELQEKRKVVAGAFALRKIVAYGSAPVEKLHPTDAATFAKDANLSVFGATVWQTQKIAPADLSYDLVVIDEGSQLEVADSAIPIRRLKPNGRLLIAGDNRQLPPIVQGDYPIVEGEPLLHRSILECLRALDREDVTVTTLLENFRMCDVLCEYPASSIYPADYAAFNDEIAQRRLPITIDASSPAVTELGLDPEYPVTMFVSENVSATAENVLEAGLVADLTFALRDRVQGEDADFWKDRLFIVSPHHAQLRAIRRALATRPWDVEPFVGTVDRMQGQECDAVIVSYGVSDVEYALGEREFIYSLNRLNVAITRARMKTIVFISRPLLEPPIQALDRDDVAEGIAFMQGLARWCELRQKPTMTQVGKAEFSVLRG